jgi:hypothetical protein
MSGRKPRRQTGYQRHRGRDDTNPQRTREPAPETREIDPQAIIIVENLLGPDEHPFAFGGKAQKPVAANDEPDFQIILQLADRGRERRLGNVGRRRRPREMLLARERDEIAKMAKKHQT